MHDLDVQRGAACGQFLACDLVGRQQGALAAHQADQSRTGALADAQDGEFGIQASPFPPPALAGACHRAAVQGGEIQDQSSQQAEREGPRLRLAEGPGGLDYFFLAASARGCCRAA